jgi:transketolase
MTEGKVVSDRHRDIATNVRKETLDIIYRSKSSHVGSAFSIVEILVALYFKCLCVSPQESHDQEKDRFILSKGHGCSALYATLSLRGLLSRDVLNGFAVNGGTLEQHPTRDIRCGIDVSTGSLGHGLSIGTGMAMSGKYDQKKYRVFVLMSDGETNEGSVWEGAMFSAHHKLDNLVAIVDYNKMQALGRTKDVIDLEPLADKWRAFGWMVRKVDGHNVEDLIQTFEEVPFAVNKPSAIIAHTIKGKGVSFMENNLLWHYRCPDDDEYKKALSEIS